MKLFARLCPFVLAILLTACASGVTRIASGKNEPVAVSPHVNAVQVQLSDAAKKLTADNQAFNPTSLQATIEKSLIANNLQQSTSTQSLGVEITSFRVRSTFSAVMFGFMAGNDNVEGIVSVKAANGEVLKKSQVTASYALGGFGGGQDDARMNWLYEEFAKHVVSEITGVSEKK